MEKTDRLVRMSRLVVRLAWVANRVFLLAVLAGLVLSGVFQGWVEWFLLQSDPRLDPHAELIDLRLLALVGIVMAVATDRLLSALRDMIVTAQAGDPFVTANARRLRIIAWSLLVLQLMDVAGALLGRFSPGLGSAAPDGEISVGGWVAVLMVFVLSRIFAAGAAMRDELAATV